MTITTKTQMGYKQTEVGVIPEDWEVVTLGSCLDAPPTYGINAPATHQTGKLPNYLRITDITEDGKYSGQNPVAVNHQLADRYILQQGDMVLARTGASVGKSYRYRTEDGELVYAGFLIRIRPNPKRLLTEYLGTYFHTSIYWRWVAATSMRSGQPGINGKEYSALPVPLPPTVAEQEAIATALSDVDALLDALDRQIAKQRDLKQAVMQQLLTGRTRLPGFSAPWKCKPIGEALSVHHGKNQKNVESPSGEYPILGSGGQIGTAAQPIYEQPSVLIGRKGTIDAPQYMDTPFWTVDTLFYTRMLHSNVAKFWYYRFWLLPWRRYNEASGVPSLNARTIESIELPAPEPKEQSAIAQVLSDMDAEISALEARRAKTAAIKQGMMQELLTGRTRLV